MGKKIMAKVNKKIANVFRIMKKSIDEDPQYKKEIYNEETGMVFNSRILFTTEEDKEESVSIIFNNGNMEIIEDIIDKPTITIKYKRVKDFKKLPRSRPEEVINMLLKNKIHTIGNVSHMSKFFFLLCYILLGQKEGYEQRKQERVEKNIIDFEDFRDWTNGTEHMKNKYLGYKVDSVKYLEDPYLSKYSLSDFKQLEYLKYIRSISDLEVCAERAKLITEISKKEGYTPEDGNTEHPGLKMGKIVNYLLTNKTPMIQEWSILPGTATTKTLGTMIYPEFGAIIFWPELYSIDNRELNPHIIDQETIDILNYEVFPYWMDRNIREYTRILNDNALSQQMDEHFVFYFMWKTQAISHTIPGFPVFLRKGINNLMTEVKQKEKEVDDVSKLSFYEGIRLALSGVLKYAENLAGEAKRRADKINLNNVSKAKLKRKEDLLRMASNLSKVPAKPAETLEEAITSIWIMWIALTQENAHMGLSLGRLDHWLQPYFEADMKKITTEEEKEAFTKRAIELMGNFFIRASDQEPLVPDVGNYLFGGSSQDFALTVGGVDKDGNTAVCDMTFIILKVAEMLTLKDPNLNARYYPGVNSKEYLDRLIEVNINTHATPSIHNDIQMLEALTNIGIKLEDARTWAATGCVEPTICGKHFGHTNSMMFNMVAAMEMAFNNGMHPVVSNKKVFGPKTGSVDDFKSFSEFLEAFKAQLHFMIEKSVEVNNYLGKAHQLLHPSPILSSLYEGPLEKGSDLVDGGALYNTSGVAMIGLADIIDTLNTIKKLIYDNREMTFSELHHQVVNDFSLEEGDILLKRIQSIPKFGTNNQITIALGQDIIDFVYDDFYSFRNYRGGKYLVGFWSMSNHVAFGTLSGALPNGRKANQPFTPGLTPVPSEKDSLIDNIQSVASLKTIKMPNNLAFNIKLVPGVNDSHEETLNNFYGYTKSYFDLGGMQIQFNVVSSDTLRDAMEHPEDYSWLMVRISGYNAYFVDLNKELQLEILNRTEFKAK
ncbi:MAG: formate acetyltransferase [Candidatus Lokiarchaeota archaeon]|nr:formate acetyltransferase [Candidatus Lokiarchaeota archaeon]MBD3199279.1 formate acetyltransferase [Candidatus Lokiarchaeota archaeon]